MAGENEEQTGQAQRGLGEIGRARASVAAVEAAERLSQPGYLGTEQDWQDLRGWAGWGPLARAFATNPEGTWAELQARLLAVLGPHEYQHAIEATPNAFYTPPEIASAMLDVLGEFGFAGGRVIEPGCGAGVFLAHDRPEIEWVGVERDPTTARIARLQHPHAQVQPAALEETALPLATAAVGNVPFEDTYVGDRIAPHQVTRNLHTYAIWRSVEALAPGGVAVLLTSRYFLDARTTLGRHAVAQQADLLSAMRLPNGALASGGTDVPVDLVVLRKRLPGEPTPADHEIPWLKSEPHPSCDNEQINSLFHQHPEWVLGTLAAAQGYRFGHTVRVDPHPDQAVPDQIRELGRVLAATAREQGRTLQAPSLLPGATEAPEVALADAEGRPEGSFHIGEDGAAYQVTGGQLAPVMVQDHKASKAATERARREATARGEDPKQVAPVRVDKGPLTGKALQELAALVRIRDAALALMEAEADHQRPDADLEPLRGELNAAYDDYVARFGRLNRATVTTSSRPASTADGDQDADAQTGLVKVTRKRPSMGGFTSDPGYPVVLSLEDWDSATETGQKADIFSRRVNTPRPRIERADGPEHALQICVDETNRVDLDRIGGLLNCPPDAVPDQLGELVFEDPATGQWHTREEYLSGAVVEALRTARAAAEQDPDRFGRNVAALEAIQPEPIPPESIAASLGASWIPPEVIEQFCQQVLEQRVTVTYTPGTAEWDLRARSAQDSVAATSQYGTHRAPGTHLVALALSGKTPTITDPDSDGKPVPNASETQAAQQKQSELREAFSRWAWQDPARADRLAGIYNERFNSRRARHYAGTHLSFPGMDAGFDPYPHQREMVHRITANPTALCGYPVGAGKTAIMFMASMKLREQGLARKPLIIVPNHLLEQVARDGKRLFPAARILMADEAQLGKRSDRHQRRLFAARCATGDWDAVVMTHSAFESLPLSSQTQADYLAESAAELEQAYRAEDTGTNRSAKSLGKALKRQRTTLNNQLSARNDDGGVTFEQLGVDYLMVDEAHYFKNLHMRSKAEGIQLPRGSNRATDLDNKLSYLRRTNPSGRIATFFTGTPLSNNVLEMYVLSHYLQPERLRAMGVEQLDAYIGTFVRTESRLEVATDGVSFRSKIRPVGYRNTPELMAAFDEVADVRTEAEIGLPRPEAVSENVVVPATQVQQDYIAEIGRRIDNRTKTDNMLKICGDGRGCAMDPRLVGLHDPEPTKIDTVAERMAAIYHANAGRTWPDGRTGALQLGFLDLGTPNLGRGDEGLYGVLRERLVAAGVPREKVRYIHEAGTAAQKATLFAQARSGEIAVLLGSTDKMGVGTNVQDLCVALHHLDPPWRPADVAQRDGRGIRPGNQLRELGEPVQVLRYITEGSFDSYMWQTLERKARFVGQLFTGEPSREEIDLDLDETVLAASEAKALATGNPLLMDHAEAKQNLTRLQRLHDSHVRGQRALDSEIELCRDHQGRLRGQIRQLTQRANKAATNPARWHYQNADLPDDQVNETLANLLSEAMAATSTRRGSVPTVSYRGIDVRFRARQHLGTWDCQVILDNGYGGHEQVQPQWLSAKNQHWRLTRAVAEAIETAGDRITELDGEIDALDQRITAADAERGKPFPHADELHRAQAHLDDLTAQINAGADQPPTDTTGTHDEVDSEHAEHEPTPDPAGTATTDTYPDTAPDPDTAETGPDQSSTSTADQQEPAPAASAGSESAPDPNTNPSELTPVTATTEPDHGPEPAPDPATHEPELDVEDPAVPEPEPEPEPADTDSQAVEASMLDRALAWHDAGVSVIPLATDGSKSPLVAWTQYQQQQPTRGQVIEWFQNGHPAMGLVCGSVSGDLELIEFEGRAVEEGLPDQWEQALAAEGHEQLHHRVTEQGLTVLSPSGGLHMLVRVDGGVESNRKLASRQARPDELTDEEQQRWNERGVWPRRVLAETRGERGYVVAAGSHGSTHPTGRSWDLVTGSPASIPRISAEERDVLHTAARGLDQLPAPAPTPEAAPSARRHDAEQGLTPGADFNARGSWAEVLEPEGWIRVREHANGATAWRRPGKNLGVSALTGGPAGDYLYVFSTSTELPAESALSRFRAYALARHGGDFSAAARALRRAGYGSTPRPEPPATSSSAREPEQPHAENAPEASEVGSDEPGPTVVLSYRQDTGVLLIGRDGDHDLGEVFDQAKRQGFQPGNWRYSASITTATGEGAHYIMGSRNRPITATILDRIATSAEQLRRRGYTVELDIALGEIADGSRREQRATRRALDRLGLTLDQVQTDATAPTISAAETAAPEQHDTDAPDTTAPAQAEPGSPTPIASSDSEFPDPAETEAADTPSTDGVEQPATDAAAEDAEEPALFPAEPAATAAAPHGIPPREQITAHLRRILNTSTPDRLPPPRWQQFLGRLRDGTSGEERRAVTTVDRLMRHRDVTAFERGRREASTRPEPEHRLRTLAAVGDLLADHELDRRTAQGNPMGPRPGEVLSEAIAAYLAGARGQADPYPPPDPDVLDQLSTDAISAYLQRTGWTGHDYGRDGRVYLADPTNPGEPDGDHQLHVHATSYAQQRERTVLVRKLARVEQRPAEQVLSALAAEPTTPEPDDAAAAATPIAEPTAAASTTGETVPPTEPSDAAETTPTPPPAAQSTDGGPPERAAPEPTSAETAWVEPRDEGLRWQDRIEDLAADDEGDSATDDGAPDWDRQAFEAEAEANAEVFASLTPEAIDAYLLRTGWIEQHQHGREPARVFTDLPLPGDSEHHLTVPRSSYAWEADAITLVRTLCVAEQRDPEQVISDLLAEPLPPSEPESRPHQQGAAAPATAASPVSDQPAAAPAPAADTASASAAAPAEPRRQLVLHHSRRDGLLLYGTRAGDQVGDVLSLARLRGHAVGTWRWDRRRLTPHGTTGAWHIQGSRGRQATERTVRTLQTTAAVLTQATGAGVQLDIADSEATAEAVQALNHPGPDRGAGPAPGSEPICRPWSERDADQWDAAAKHEITDASGITVVEAAEIEGRWAVQAQTVIDGHHIAVRMSLAHEERAQQLARQITEQPRMLPRLARNLAVLGDGTAEVNGDPLPATTTAAELRSRLAGRGPYATGQQHSQQTDPRQSAAAALTPPSTHPEAQATRRPHPGPPPPRRPAQPRAEHGPRRTL